MLEGTDLKLFFEWLEFYELEPFGEQIDNIRNAINCITIASSLGAKKPGGGNFTLQDFMPEFGKKQPSNVYSPEDARAILKKLYGKNSS